MAKIKIKNANDLLVVSERDGRMVLDLKQNGSDKDMQVNVGLFHGQLKQIEYVLMAEEAPKHEEHNMDDYLKARKEMLELSLDERVKKQKGIYQLTCGVYHFVPTASLKKKDIQDCRSWLEEHPYRMWTDVRVWINNWRMTKDSADASGSAILGRVMAVDAAEEREQMADEAQLSRE